MRKPYELNSSKFGAWRNFRTLEIFEGEKKLIFLSCLNQEDDHLS